MADRQIVPEAKNSRASEGDRCVGSICHFAGQETHPKFLYALERVGARSYVRPIYRSAMDHRRLASYCLTVNTA